MDKQHGDDTESLCETLFSIIFARWNVVCSVCEICVATFNRMKSPLMDTIKERPIHICTRIHTDAAESVPSRYVCA